MYNNNKIIAIILKQCSSVEVCSCYKPQQTANKETAAVWMYRVSEEGGGRGRGGERGRGGREGGGEGRGGVLDGNRVEMWEKKKWRKSLFSCKVWERNCVCVCAIVWLCVCVVVCLCDCVSVCVWEAEQVQSSPWCPGSELDQNHEDIMKLNQFNFHMKFWFSWMRRQNVTLMFCSVASQQTHSCFHVYAVTVFGFSFLNLKIKLWWKHFFLKLYK